MKNEERVKRLQYALLLLQGEIRELKKRIKIKPTKLCPKYRQSAIKTLQIFNLIEQGKSPKEIIINYPEKASIIRDIFYSFLKNPIRFTKWKHKYEYRSRGLNV